MGRQLLQDLPGHRREGQTTVNGQQHDALYMKCKTWLDGGTIDI
jgi:hypothetical protein